MSLRGQFFTLLFLCNPITLFLLTHSLLDTIALCVSFTCLLWYICKYLHNPGWKILFFNIVAIFSLFYNAELIFRHEFQQWNIPNLYKSYGKYYFNKPNLDETFCTPEYNTIYRTNVDGYRIANNQPFYDKIDQCDLLFIGDSYTQGAQVDYSEMFSSIIEDSLPQFKILNAGISGAGIIDELYYYLDRGRLLNPKLVILQLGVFNDFMDVCEHQTNIKSFLREKSSLFRFFEHNISISKTNLPLGRWTEPIFPQEQLNKELNILYSESSTQKELDKNNLANSLKQFNIECKRNNTTLLVVLIPSKEQTSEKLFDEVITEYGLDKNKFDLTFPNNWLKRVCENNHIELLDMTSTFQESRQFPFLQIDEHMNINGHQIVAKEILNYIKTNNNLL